MTDIQEKILLLTGMGSGLLYFFKTTNSSEVSKYKTEEGKFIWSLYLFDFVIHIMMALFGATVVYFMFELKVFMDMKEYQLLGSVIGGLIARESLPLILDLAREEIEVLVEKRRDRRQ